MPTLNTDIFKKRFTIAPPEITGAILHLCHEIAPGSQPKYVTVTPETEAQISECFSNVEAKVATAGGEILYGWTIWIWPNVFVEAEHHAVWRQGDELVDVTPHVHGERRILFLPDPERIYDSVHHKRIINVKRSLGVISAAQAFIDASDSMAEYIEEVSDGLVMNADPVIGSILHHETQRAMAAVIFQLARRLKPHDPCLCSSGRKFRKCCGPLIDLTITL